jgi:hypothetical protein
MYVLSLRCRGDDWLRELNCSVRLYPSSLIAIDCQSVAIFTRFIYYDEIALKSEEDDRLRKDDEPCGKCQSMFRSHTTMRPAGLAICVCWIADVRRRQLVSPSDLMLHRGTEQKLIKQRQAH